MQPDDYGDIAHKLLELRGQHRHLDEAIHAMAALGQCDELELKRMKKRKLALKDLITRLESRLIPDLDA